ncbi:hypothetical protein [Synechocystis sp. PCC 7509]|uniref:hypothetical protein n=1 Tax=Synechocystis sp. PCC 7509 TaxID=927677 RepID=UPI000686D957|nr:hypothetical protein [Synechocystis sp. PCC 7509]
MEHYFQKNSSERGSCALAPQHFEAAFLNKDISLPNLNLISWFNWIYKKLNSKVDYTSSGKVEFKSKVDAKEFTDQAVAWAKQRAEIILAATREQVGEEIEQGASKGA